VAFKSYTNLGLGQIDFLFSTNSLGAVIGMLPAGLALDRLGAKRSAWVAGLSILLVMGTLAAVLAKNFWML
jgi:MFS family permease